MPSRFHLDNAILVSLFNRTRFPEVIGNPLGNIFCLSCIAGCMVTILIIELTEDKPVHACMREFLNQPLRLHSLNYPVANFISRKQFSPEEFAPSMDLRRHLFHSSIMLRKSRNR